MKPVSHQQILSLKTMFPFDEDDGTCVHSVCKIPCPSYDNNYATLEINLNVILPLNILVNMVN